MATTQIEFINVNPGSLSNTDSDDRRKVRIQVMKDFRRKERERQAAKNKSTVTPSEAARSVSPIPQHIRSPPLTQVALTQKLRDGWFPIGFGFSTLVPAVVRSWAPVLATLDSMKLVHLGSCVKDERLLIEGRKRFLLAMNSLRSNLTHTPDMELPGLMLVSVGISMTEIYNAISDNSTPTSWQKHVVGMSALLLKQRPIDTSSPLETFMIARLRTAQLLRSLCNRQPFPAQYEAPPLRSSTPAADFVLDLAFRLPPLLASADQVTNQAVQEAATHHEAVRGLAKVVRELVALKKIFDSWLKSFCEHIEGGNASPRWLKENKRSLPDVTAESLCRICLLLILRTLCELHESQNSDTASQAHAKRLAVSCAEDLYQTTLLLLVIAERPVSKALSTRAPLHFLCQYYQSVNDCPRLERCNEIIETLRTEAPYLNWEMLLPWSLLPLTSVRGAGGPLTAHLTITPFNENGMDTT